MHFFIFFVVEDKIIDVVTIDQIICVEFPDLEVDPIIYNTTLRTMVHGSCGSYNLHSPCMKDARCSKCYPKGFQKLTFMDADGYPLYKRKNNIRWGYETQGLLVVNQDVVPYNPFVSKKYGCHISIEICASIGGIKYIHTFIFTKDTIVSLLQFDYEPNEVEQYLDAQYVNALEARWHLFAMEMHEEQPNVICLVFHLLGMHRVMFNANNDVTSILQRAKHESTTLNTYFTRCVIDANARQYTYLEFPQHFVWNTTTKRWTPRQIKFVFERLYFIDPTIREHYELRLPLTIVWWHVLHLNTWEQCVISIIPSKNQRSMYGNEITTR